MTGDEIVRRARMALTEIGFPSDAVYVDMHGRPIWRPYMVPADVIYKARQVIGAEPRLCRPCWDKAVAVAKATGTRLADNADCAAPWMPDCGSES